MSPTHHASQTTRTAALDAALSLLDQTGVAGVTLAKVSELSGVSNGSIYHHFGSREGLLRTLLLRSFASLAATLTCALDGASAEESIRQLVQHHLQWVGDNRAEALAVYLVTLSPIAARQDDLAERKTELLAPLVTWFDQKAEQGAVRALPLWALDPIALGPVHEIARRHLAAPGDGLIRPAVVRATADAVWAVLRP